MLTVIGLVIFTVELLHLSATFEAEPDRSIIFSIILFLEAALFPMNSPSSSPICRVLTATKANKTERFIRSSALLDTKSTHSLNARSHCSVCPVCPACTTAVHYALLLIQPLYTTTTITQP